MKPSKCPNRQLIDERPDHPSKERLPNPIMIEAGN